MLPSNPGGRRVAVVYPNHLSHHINGTIADEGALCVGGLRLNVR